MVNFIVRSFQVPKAGNEPEECEDALGWDEAQRLFAIADGATDSAFQRLWAQLLVEGFIHHAPDTFAPVDLRPWFEKWLGARQREWHLSIDWDNVPWHGLNKARQIGALATFMGIYIAPESPGQGGPAWQGIAIGDCHLFHFWKGDTLNVIYPSVEDSEQAQGTDWTLYDQQPATYDFGTQPATLSSINRNHDITWKHMHWLSGTYHQGDIIVLTTDALAHWIVSQLWSRQSEAWTSLLTLEDPSAFSALIDALRQERQIRNDDTSMLVIQIAGQDGPDEDPQL
jgi:hypothetical protein